MRRLLTGLAVCLFALPLTAPAYAAATGQIDHVEVADDGSMKLLYSIPDSVQEGPDLDSIRVEVAGQPVEATASAVEAGAVKRTSVLALDVSASMRGARFAAAQEAALAYLDSAPDDVAIGLVTFAGSVDVVTAPTTDHQRLRSAVEGLELARGTRLYDGLLEAIGQLGKEGQRQVLLLSDGADTSSTSLVDAVARSQQSGVVVDVVALEQSSQAEARLREITDATKGRVFPASEPDALADVFTEEAEALARQVLVEFTSSHDGEATIDVRLHAGDATYRDSTFVSLPGRTAGPSTSTGPRPIAEPGLVLDERALLVGAAALGLGMAVVVALLLMGKPKGGNDLVQRQLDFYSGQRGQGRPQSPSARPQLDVRGSAVAVAGQIVKSGGFEERLTKRLGAAGMSLTAAEWLLLHAGITVVLGLAALMLSGGNPVTIGVSLLLGGAGPWLYLSMKETRRLKAFNSQLADTLQLMSGGLSAGLSLPQAVDTVVREGTEPMTGELRRALVEQRLGVDIEDALDGVAERMQSKDFAWVVMAIRIQREIGGNLAELLNTVAATIREREYLRRQVRALSAEGRLSALILGGLPPVFALYLAATKPGYLLPMYTTSLGWMLSIGAVVMLGLGALWLKTVVKVEV